MEYHDWKQYCHLKSQRRQTSTIFHLQPPEYSLNIVFGLIHDINDTMIQKSEAIDRYIQEQFNTDKDVNDL